MGRSADSGRMAYWRELIKRRRHSGLIVAQYCADVGVSSASYYLWQRKLRDRRPRAQGPGESTTIRPTRKRSGMHWLVDHRYCDIWTTAAWPSTPTTWNVNSGRSPKAAPNGCSSAAKRPVPRGDPVHGDPKRPV